jgi:hypothetical protein
MGKYALSLMYPTHRAKPIVGVPMFPTLPSQKVRSFVNVSAAIGTQGVGYLAVTPTLCNDTDNYVFTTAAYTGDGELDTGSGQIGVTSGSMVNAPYSDAQIAVGAPTLQGRLVSCGVKVSYTGTQLNMGGTYYAYTEPVQGALASNGGTLTYVDLATRKGCIIRPITRGSIGLAELPVDEDQLSYGADCFPWNTQFNSSMVIVFIGTARNTFDVQITVDMEFMGTTVEGVSTPNPVVNTSPTGPISHSAESIRRKNAVGQDISRAVGGVIGGAAMHYLSGAVSTGASDAGGLIQAEDAVPILEDAMMGMAFL